MDPPTPAGAEPAGADAVHAWLSLLLEVVELLLRQAERHLESDTQAAYAAGQSSTVRLRQLERDQVRLLLDRVRRVRSAQAAEGGS